VAPRLATPSGFLNRLRFEPASCATWASPCSGAGLGKFAEMPHILRMTRRKSKLFPWKVIAITASPATMYGVVRATDDASAAVKAIEEFPDQNSA
jgi:hypothetical protein